MSQVAADAVGMAPENLDKNYWISRVGEVSQSELIRSADYVINIIYNIIVSYLDDQIERK